MVDQRLFPPAFARELNAAMATARLELEPLTAAHVEVMFPAYADARIYRWIACAIPREDEMRAKWRAWETRLTADGRLAQLNWAVRRRSDGAYIGKFDAQINVAKEAVNIGFVFMPDSWGQGYATEATQALLAKLKAAGVGKARATVAIGNHASERVLVKSGFSATGLSTEEEDTIVYDLVL